MLLNQPDAENRPGNPFFRSMVITLEKPSQVTCIVRGRCDASPATFFRLLLKWPDGHTDEVSHTMANPWAPNESLQVSASLYLPPGTYTWTAQLGLTIGGGPPGGDIDNFQPEIVGQHPGPVVVTGGNIGVFGHSEGWFLVSCAQDYATSGRFTITGSLAENRTLTATVLFQQFGGTIVQSYPAEIRWPNHPPLFIDLAFFRIRAGAPTKFWYVYGPTPHETIGCGLHV